METQCTTVAQCHKELTRVMEQFGIQDQLSAIRSRYVTYEGWKWEGNCFPVFDHPERWKFAITEINGRPVFYGDKIYDAIGEQHTVPYTNSGLTMRFDKHNEWSCIPPKPNTVMVEMKREDAEYWLLIGKIATYRKHDDYAACSRRFYASVEKALEDAE